MRLLIQRVNEGEIWIENKLYSRINKGIVAFLGIGENDDDRVIDYLVDKLVHLRIFPDEKGVMNHSLLQVKGDLMIASQFTLYGDCRKGRRPSYAGAMNPEFAKVLYDQFIKKAKHYKLKVETGQFQAMMDIKLINSGPVTLLLDSEKNF